MSEEVIVTEEVGGVPDVYNMSDDDFLNQDFSEVVTDVEETSDEQGEEAEAEESEEESTDANAEPDVEDTGEEEAEEDSESVESEETSEGTSDATEESDDEESDEATDDSKEESIEDYQAQIDELFAPIKANGKDVKVNSIEEARKFISMGMGFNKKMEALKPARLLQKKMQEHNLLEEGKLDFLIALDKKNPEAIARLLKDSELNPLNIDVDSDSSYQPETYSGGEDTLALEDVITDLENSDYASDIASLISTKWGESSREILRSQPGLLNIIDSHMKVGIYDSIIGRIDQEKMLGSHMGISDVEAYGQVAEQMNKEGLFAHLAPKPVERKPVPIIKAAMRKPKVDPNLKRKRATAVTKSTPATKKPEPAYLGMSDDDFMKSM
jgi:hypothetical protein